ncbi:MAG TPA: YheC/YheD family protein [Bacillota bacterium]|mgnify:CR=1 FL=1|nr:YheC/YheD family protein [Bacillota bacterium]
MKQAQKKPVVGLFVDDSVIMSLQKQKTSRFFRLNLYAGAARKAGVKLVLFSPGCISFNPDKLDGMIYNHRLHRWEAAPSPLPDIIYDRLVGGSPELVREADKVRHELNRRGVIKLNAQPYFDKLNLYQTLLRCDRVSPHLPPTRKYRGAETLLEMFKGSSRLYLKAVDGRSGKQVVQVARSPQGGYYYRYFNERLFSGKTATLPALEKIIKQVTGHKKAIVQKAVDLVQVNNQLMDLRGEMQRNARGELEIVAILVRLGQKGSPITTHGESYQFEDFYHTRLNRSRKEIALLKERINDFLYAVYDCVERAYGPFGEIAIDFGIDRKGKIWLFECNAKSMKVSLLKSADPDATEKAFLNPMLYARYLYYSRQSQDRGREQKKDRNLVK